MPEKVLTTSTIPTTSTPTTTMVSSKPSTHHVVHPKKEQISSPEEPLYEKVKEDDDDLLDDAHATSKVEHDKTNVLANVQGMQGLFRKCPTPHANVDFDPHNESTVSLDHIPFPEMCCAMCHGIPECKAWVWKLDPTFTGCKYRCWVLNEVPPASQHAVRKGVSSGVPPPRPILTHIVSAAEQQSGFGVADEARTGNGTAFSQRRISLFCFSLVLPYGYEKKFLAMQHSLETSIFACDKAAVYSNLSFEVAPSVNTRTVDSDLVCGRGGDSYTALNTWIFMAVWKRVIDDGFYSEHDWTVKVDPDAVFFADRLRIILKDHAGAGYLSNCQYGLHGPIEVLSQHAVEALAKDYASSEKGDKPAKCVKHLHFGLWGEDMFLAQCFSKVLGVKGELETRLLCEANCNCPDWFWCHNGTDRVSYHPFKREDMYRQCMANALYSSGPPNRRLLS